jgi:hypothetical protein
MSPIIDLVLFVSEGRADARLPNRVNRVALWDRWLLVDFRYGPLATKVE